MECHSAYQKLTVAGAKKKVALCTAQLELFICIFLGLPDQHTAHHRNFGVKAPTHVRSYSSGTLYLHFLGLPDQHTAN